MEDGTNDWPEQPKLVRISSWEFIDLAIDMAVATKRKSLTDVPAIHEAVGTKAELKGPRSIYLAHCQTKSIPCASQAIDTLKPLSPKDFPPSPFPALHSLAALIIRRYTQRLLIGTGNFPQRTRRALRILAPLPPSLQDAQRDAEERCEFLSVSSQTPGAHRLKRSGLRLGFAGDICVNHNMLLTE